MDEHDIEDMFPDEPVLPVPQDLPGLCKMVRPLEPLKLFE